MGLHSILRFGALTILTGALLAPAWAESIKDKTDRQQAQIPVCGKKIGSIAVYEPERTWWLDLKLESPEALLKVFISQSGCFTLVDRNKGFSLAEKERALAQKGDLRGGSNIGKGQVKAADYILVPDIANSNNNAGDTAIGGLVGSFFGHKAGAIAGMINIKSSTADVILTVTDVRSSEQVALTQGHGEKSDVAFVIAGGQRGTGAAGAGSYQNTEIGQVIALAYIDAYAKLVQQLGGLPHDASAANAQQAVTVIKPSRMYASTGGKGKVVRSLSVGMMLYPTGAKDGVWWEVTDEMGNKGWVSNLMLQLSK